MAEQLKEQVLAAARRHWGTMKGLWLVLACLPHVVQGDYFRQGYDNFLEFNLPPRATRLVVHRSTAPLRKTIDDQPYVVAADCHGRILLYASQGPALEPLVVDAFYPGPLDVQHGYHKAYFICNMGGRVSARLDHPILHPSNACLISSSSGFTVVELQPKVGTDHATLLLYYSYSKNWREEELNYLPCDRPWGANGVVVHLMQIWWVDLSYGLLACHFSAVHHVLRFVPLPKGCELPPGTADLDKRCCVGMSAGRLRYVQIQECDGEPMASMWTLLNPLQAGTWHLDCEVRFETIWADEGYRATKLPRLVPTVAFINPNHPGEVAYFLLHSRLFGVDLHYGKVLEWQFFTMVHPPMAEHSSRFVHIWKIDDYSARPDSGT
ncbi:hypothetical protein GUJ93_ZPchr0001g29753 [Zizania palustris]|uniref:DUF1618 domain-containing protein n=1 Tax=Zizania palustris TaxID=103762 RepID=A0A8J5R6R7_ZIZPA|nr:hypothetical protein GUJ93_ZPchr0001g29753 [Zizania palustris]